MVAVAFIVLYTVMIQYFDDKKKGEPTCQVLLCTPTTVVNFSCWYTVHFPPIFLLNTLTRGVQEYPYEITSVNHRS
jgi:hypothetical protein